MPLTAISLYLLEKHKQTVYQEDCMYLMAAVNIQDNKKHMLRQSYLRNEQSKKHKTNNMPNRTKEETINFIFEGINNVERDK